MLEYYVCYAVNVDVWVCVGMALLGEVFSTHRTIVGVCHCGTTWRSILNISNDCDEITNNFHSQLRLVLLLLSA